ncbi:MAG TPA: hypothetical protein VF487_06430 [Chitinophagaceae bacterium]
MKHLFSSLLRCHRKAFALTQTGNYSVLLFCTTLTVAFLMTGCQKENLLPRQEEIQSKNNRAVQAESNGFGNYKGLAPETEWQLQQAKIATARYNDFENAINDDYVDINVIVPEMGYHYLKVAHLDGTFEYNKPEILVYNKEENGRMKLVAVEYAVPIALSPNAPPSGFAGTNDVWGVYQGVLWTLHAWVWEYNPDGVFNPTNPLVHLH